MRVAALFGIIYVNLISHNYVCCIFCWSQDLQKISLFFLTLYSLVKLGWHGWEFRYCLSYKCPALRVPGKKTSFIVQKAAWLRCLVIKFADVQSEEILLSRLRKLFWEDQTNGVHELSIVSFAYIRRSKKYLYHLWFRVIREAFIDCRSLL